MSRPALPCRMCGHYQGKIHCRAPLCDCLEYVPVTSRPPKYVNSREYARYLNPCPTVSDIAGHWKDWRESQAA